MRRYVVLRDILFGDRIEHDPHRNGASVGVSKEHLGVFIFLDGDAVEPRRR